MTPQPDRSGPAVIADRLEQLFATRGYHAAVQAVLLLEMELAVTTSHYAHIPKHLRDIAGHVVNPRLSVYLRVAAFHYQRHEARRAP